MIYRSHHYSFFSILFENVQQWIELPRNFYFKQHAGNNDINIVSNGKCE